MALTRRGVSRTVLATRARHDSLVSFQVRGPPISRIIPRALSVAVTAADIALPSADFDDFTATVASMLLSMETDNTWKPLGAVAGRIAAKLIAARTEIESPPAPGRAESGGSVPPGTRRNRSQAASAKSGEDRLPHPAGWNSWGRLNDRERQATPSGSVRGGERTTGNVIHWLAHAPLRDAWGAHRNSPVHGALPAHPKRRPAKRGHCERPPHGSR